MCHPLVCDHYVLVSVSDQIIVRDLQERIDRSGGESPSACPQACSLQARNDGAVRPSDHSEPLSQLVERRDLPEAE
jgi:hypothetical protein